MREYMDMPDCSEERLFRTLDQFRVTNRLFTRYRYILTRGVIKQMRRDPARSYRLADLGAGGCDIARWLIRRCRSEGLRLGINAIENDPRILRYAAAANRGFPEIELVQADALDFCSRSSPDFVFANHLLHHLPDDACIELLGRLARMPLIRYMLSDIVRSRTAASAFKVLAGPLFRDSFVCEDGLISIRRGFTPRELDLLIRRSRPACNPKLRFMPPARFLIEGTSARTI